MTPEQAMAYISNLTYDEKLKLNELLKALEQKHQPDQVPLALNDITSK